MFFLWLSSSFLLITSGISTAKGEHILFFHACSTYSHRLPQWPLVEALISRGHNVTFISPWYPKGNYTNDKVNDITPKTVNKIAVDLFAAIVEGFFEVDKLSPPHFYLLDNVCLGMCEAILKSKEVQDWVKGSPNVDLVISDTWAECSYGMTKKLKAKNALFTPSAIIMKHFEAFGINPESSSIPDEDLVDRVPLSFPYRVGSVLLPLAYMAMDFYFWPKYKAIFKETLNLNDEDVPSAPQVYEMTDLIFTNGDFLTDYPRSLPPFVVKVEGIHLRRNAGNKGFSENVKAFLKREFETVVYISFGTLISTQKFLPAWRDLFLRVVKSLPDIGFIWKWDGDRPANLPDNILMEPWVNQIALLEHPKTKLFISHAGKPSTLEALHCQVPTITFPLVAEQFFNAYRSEEFGVSVFQGFKGITDEKLRKTILSVLANHTIYTAKLKKLSSLINDVRNDPLETAVWWTEFVMRHSREELQLLKPLAGKLTWYQRRDLDVWLFLLLVFLLVVSISLVIVRRVITSLVNVFKKKGGKVKRN